MAHYSVEIKGAAPIDWEMLRGQRETLVTIAFGDMLSPVETDAVDGVVNLLDAMIDTHDGSGAD